MAEPATLALGWRLARRELRGGLAGFRLLLACLALGVFAIAAIGSVSTAIRSSLEAHARDLLGGDLEFRLAQRPMPDDAASWLRTQGQISTLKVMRAMLRVPDGESALTEIKVADAAYPLAGVVSLSPAGTLAAALAVIDGVPGIVVAPGLLDRLHAKIGDRLLLGDAAVQIRAVLASEPDSGGGMFALGPRSIIGWEALAATGLDRPGTLSTTLVRVGLPASVEPEAVAVEAKRRFPDAGWSIRDRAHASEGIQNFVERTASFLSLAGLASLAVGGLGVANAVRAYLIGKESVIATLKCLGAPARLILVIYFMQILVLASVGIVGGTGFGALAPLVVQELFGGLLPVPLDTTPHPLPLVEAALFGLLTTITYALWPLARARRLSPTSLFRRGAGGSSGAKRLNDLPGVAVSALLLVSLVIGLSAVPVQAAWFLAGLAVALAIFWLVARLIMAGARRLGRLPLHPPAWLRLALANLHRPGNATLAVSLSLGIGLTLLVAVDAVERTLEATLGDAVAAHAPSFFFIDIQPDQVADFTALLRAESEVTDVALQPSLRTRITSVNTTPIEQVHAAERERDLARQERGLSYADSLPPGSTLTSGAWWPQDYAGPPLASIDETLAKGLGIGVGDTLTLDVVGHSITARIANLRHIDWIGFGINFFMLLDPHTLKAAPQTWIATARVPPGAPEAALANAVAGHFPNVSSVPVRDAIATVRTLLGAFAAVIRVTAVLCLATGILVLAGAVAAGHRQRLADAVVLKVLGATRGDVVGAFVAEYGVLGLVTAFIATGVGTLSAWLVVTDIMHAQWIFLPITVLATVAGSATLTIAIGLVGTWWTLRQKPGPLLRNA